MRQTTEHIKILLFAAALSAVGGCTERELSERPADGPLIVHLEWPEGAGGDDATVDGAHLLLYRSDGSLHQRIECEAEGHECRVPADTYTILAVNSDRANTSYANHESHQQCRLLADGHPTEEGVLMHVGNVYSTGLQGVEVRPGNAATEVTLRPENRVKLITFDIDPGYIESIASMQLRMTGVVPSVRMADGEDMGEETQHLLAQAGAKGDGNYQARMSVFGWRGENIVTAALEYTDGRPGQTTIPQDISGQLASLPDDGGTVHVTLELPDGGQLHLTVTVGEWNEGTGSGIVGGEGS